MERRHRTSAAATMAMHSGAHLPKSHGLSPPVSQRRCVERQIVTNEHRIVLCPPSTSGVSQVTMDLSEWFFEGGLLCPI